MKKILAALLLSWISSAAFGQVPATVTTTATQTLTGPKTFSGSCVSLWAGSTSGSTCVNAPAIAGSTTQIILPAMAGTLTLQLIPTAVKTSGYTAAVNDLVIADTTSAGFTVNLPAGPIDGSRIGIKQVTRGGTNVVTIATGGSDVFNKTGGATTATLTLSGAAMTLQYKASGAIWYIVDDDMPYGSLLANANTWTGVQAFGAVTGTTFNGNAWTTGTGTLALGAGKTATVSNTLTFTGTDASSVAFGTGGTVQYTSSSVTCSQEPARTGDVTASAGSCANTLVNIPTAIPAAGSVVFGNIAAPSSPSTAHVAAFADSTDLRFHDKNASGVIGTTVVADTGASNNFLTAVSVAGAISKAQPAFSNLSGSVTCAQEPALTGVIVTSAGACATSIASQTGTGTKFVMDTAPTISNPVITNIAPAADFTLTQNSVVPFTSVNSGAVANTLYLKTGNVGIGTATPDVAFDVATSNVVTHADILSANQVAGAAMDIQTSTGAPPSGAIQAFNVAFLAKYVQGSTITNNFNVFRMVAQTDSSMSDNISGTFSAGNFQAKHKGTGIASLINGVIANVGAIGAGVITNADAFTAGTPTIAGGGTITNAFGIAIQVQKTTGVTNGYGVYQQSALDTNYFAGNVGIGMTPPVRTLDVTGTFGATGAANFGGAITAPSLATSSSTTTGTLCWTTGTGNINVDTTTTCLLSGEQYKKNARPLDPMAGLPLVMAMQPKAYTLRDEYNPAHLGEQVGFFAQDAAELDTRLVSFEDDGVTPHAMRYQQYTANITLAIQQQQAMIDALQVKVRQLSSTCMMQY